jgi:hypothetical protein
MQTAKIMHPVEATLKLRVPVSELVGNTGTKLKCNIFFEAVLIVYHKGATLDGGHYTADILSDDGEWYAVNDAKFEEGPTLTEPPMKSMPEPQTSAEEAKFAAGAASRSANWPQTVAVVYRRVQSL